MFAQLALLPLPRIGGHVHGDGEAELGAHDADGHAEVAGRAHRNAVLAEELAELVREQLAIVVLFAEQTGLDGQPFGVGQHLVDAATGLDGAGDGQVAVFFEQQLAGQLDAVALVQGGLHRRDGRYLGLQNAFAGAGLGEGVAHVGGEAGEAGGGIRHIVAIQAHIGQTDRQGGGLGVEPGHGFECDQGANQRELGNELLDVDVFHGMSRSCYTI
ncbi:hypothetical protein D3C79_778740 [compost metagenome]